jgi:hypothetical protein
MRAEKQEGDPWMGYCVQHAFLQSSTEPQEQACTAEKLLFANTPTGGLAAGGAYVTAEMLTPEMEEEQAKREEYLEKHPGAMLQAPACRSIAAGLRQLYSSSFASPVLYSRASLTKTLQTAMIGECAE